jgi:glutathione S-transferase
MVLAEKRLPYERIEIDLKNKPADFHKVSPYGKVPVLLDGETRVYESAIVNEYLDEKYPDPPLMPPAPEGRAYVRMWVDFANNHLMPAGFRARRAEASKREEAMAAFLGTLDMECRDWREALVVAIAVAHAFALFARLMQEEASTGAPEPDGWFERSRAP